VEDYGSECGSGRSLMNILVRVRVGSQKDSLGTALLLIIDDAARCADGDSGPQMATKRREIVPR
jgi:hypothetical protein